ncbi:galactosyltransferase, partial [Helicosporidium sp. ATCC 50920]
WAPLAARRTPCEVFVGIQSGFSPPGAAAKYDYTARRAALRRTWVLLARAQGLVVRFVMGHSPDAALEAAVAAEEEAHGDFLRLDMEEAYADLPRKTVAFLQAVMRAYAPRYVLKVDDDVYLRPSNLMSALAQWSRLEADYVGCMKQGEVFSAPNFRWFEPQHALLGGHYFTHAWGSVYALSGAAAQQLLDLPLASLRHFANEDVTVGAWMLALNATHYDDRRLCAETCKPGAVAVYDFPTCAGLCDPAPSLDRLHASEDCLRQDDHAPWPSLIRFRRGV